MNKQFFGNVSPLENVVKLKHESCGIDEIPRLLVFDRIQPVVKDNVDHSEDDQVDHGIRLSERNVIYLWLLLSSCKRLHSISNIACLRGNIDFSNTLFFAAYLLKQNHDLRLDQIHVSLLLVLALTLRLNTQQCLFGILKTFVNVVYLFQVLRPGLVSGILSVWFAHRNFSSLK